MTTLAAGRTARLGAAVLQLTRVRITAMVTLTTATGYLMRTGRPDWGLLAPAMGTFLLAAGASALNQCQEADVDGRMPRTRGRPIPSGLLPRPVAAAIAAGLIVLGLWLLLVSSPGGGVTAAALGVLAVAWYNGLYTYLKRVTAYAVVPGAVIGAIPPVIGWVAAGGHVADPRILTVAAFFFVWQVPHFWLLLLLFGQEYAMAGLPALTRTLGRPRLRRVTFALIAVTAAMGLALGVQLGSGVGRPWALLLAVASVWLVVRTAGLALGGGPDDRAAYRRAFVQINLYALMVMAALVCDALGLWAD